MSLIIISPRNAKELAFVREILSKMKIRNKLFTVEERKDLGMSVLLKKEDIGQKVSRGTIMKKLK